MLKAVIPECYIDTCLVNVLLNAPTKKGVNHGKGISSVAEKMKREFADSFSVGIVDRDKRSVAYLENDFTIINDSISEYAILHKHRLRHHYFIQLCPVSETWICNVTNDIGIDLQKDFSLPNEPKMLTRETKKVSSKYDARFEKLFRQILKKSEDANFEPILKLKGWLEALVEHNYQVDINELRK